MSGIDIKPQDDAELTRLAADAELGKTLNPSVALAYRSACAYLGRKPTGKGRRRTIAEAQGVLRRREQHAASAQQAAAVKARRTANKNALVNNA